MQARRVVSGKGIAERQGRSMSKKHYKVSGNDKIGFRLIVPKEAHMLAGRPTAYTCWYGGDGTIVYQPVRP